MRRVIWVVVVVCACKHYDRARMEAVCKGEGYSDAALYDPAFAPLQYPLAEVEKWANSQWAFNTTDRFRSATIGPNRDNYERVSLALCIEQQPGPFARDCTMDSYNTTMELGDGDPKVKVERSAGKTKTVKAYASHFILTLREAKTAKVLATKTVDVPVEMCPLVSLTDDPNDYVEIPEQELVDFASPLLPKPIATALAEKP